MRHALLATVAVLTSALPATAFAVPTAAPKVTKQSICQEVIVITPEGEAPGLLCYVQSGRV